MAQSGWEREHFHVGFIDLRHMSLGDIQATRVAAVTVDAAQDHGGVDVHGRLVGRGVAGEAAFAARYQRTVELIGSGPGDIARAQLHPVGRELGELDPEGGMTVSA